MDRRHYLALVGSGLTVSTAGCAGDDDDNGGDDSTDNGGSENGGDNGSDDSTDNGGSENGGDNGSDDSTDNGGGSDEDGNSEESSGDDENDLSDVLGQAVDISGTADSDIDQLDVIDHRMARGEGNYIAEGPLGIALLVENTGEATADLVFEYSYMRTVYDTSDEEMFPDSDYANGASAPAEANPLDPGASGPVILIAAAYEKRDQIGRYEVTVTCRSGDEGTYCE